MQQVKEPKVSMAAPRTFTHLPTCRLLLAGTGAVLAQRYAGMGSPAPWRSHKLVSLPASCLYDTRLV